MQVEDVYTRSAGFISLPTKERSSMYYKNFGAYGARTRNLRRDRAAL